MRIYADFTFHWFGFYISCGMLMLHEALTSIICGFAVKQGKGEESALMEKIYIIEDDENITKSVKDRAGGLWL